MDGEGKDLRQLKHNSINGAIERLSRIKNKPQDLSEEVTGIGAPSVSSKLEENKALISLKEILDTTAERLNSVGDDFERIIVELRESLF